MRLLVLDDDRPLRDQRHRERPVGQALRRRQPGGPLRRPARGHRHALSRGPPRVRHVRSRHPAAAPRAGRRGRRRGRCG